jgi:hypothetical protein
MKRQIELTEELLSELVVFDDREALIDQLVAVSELANTTPSELWFTLKRLVSESLEKYPMAS